jgi:hypothetical protein
MQPATATGRATLIMIALVAGVATPFSFTPAQVTSGLQGTNVTVSGHFDVQAVGRNAEVKDNNFTIGQFALDLTADLNPRVLSAVEIAYGVNDDVRIGQAYVDWTLYQWNGKPRYNPLGTVSMGVMAGQFDVPFGLDWRDYASIDRPLVSVPLVISNTHRGWNDLGVEAHAALTWANVSVFAVNGFGTSPTLRLPERPAPTSLIAGSDNITASDLIPSEAFGARFGLVMNQHFEFGTSFAAGYTDKNAQTERLFGVDLTGKNESFELKAEFINHQRNRTVAKESVFGYYLQGMYTINPQWFAVVRADGFNGDGTEVYPFALRPTGTMLSTSAGAGYRLHPNAQFRVEYQLAEGKSNDTVFLQTVVGF